METAVENEVTPSESQDSLAPYRNEEFVLLINNKELLKYIQLILKEMLKFPNVSVAEMGLTKQKAVENVAKVIMTKDAHVLLNPPLKLDNAQHDTDLDAWDNFLVNVKTRVEQTKGDKEKTLNCMSKIATVLTAAENYQMREKYVRLFAGFRIPSVFFFPRPASDKPAEQVQEISLILKDYLVELLSDKSSAIEKIKASEEEAELSEKKKEVDKLMAEGEKHKQDRNYEAAVQCFEQAIRILPQDPDAYIESGQGNTKLKNYRKALRRFGEAEEIAQDIPASNREIGNVKMIQAKELIEQGEDEDSEKVRQLLNEAKQNFKTALGKAEKLKPLGHDDKNDRSAEAVSEITRSISEHGLSEKLGAEHGIVKELSVMVSESLEKKGIKRDSATLSTPDRITLGLVAADNKEYDEAEKMLFQSAEDKKYLKDACWGINYLGAQVRQHGEVDHAFEIYQRLLTLDPPNKGAVYFNLAVAWNKRDNYVDSASSLIQAIYVDPSLPHDEMFKQNLAMSKMLKDLVLLFGKVENNEGNLKPVQEEAPPPQPEKEPAPMYTPQPNERYAYLREKFEELLKADKKKAMKAIYYFASKEPRFFKSAEIYGSQLIMDAIKRIYSITKSSGNQTTKKFTDLVAELIEREKDLVLPSNSNFKNIKEKLEKVIKVNANGASIILTKLVKADRSFFSSEDIYQSKIIMGLIAETLGKNKNNGVAGDQGFIDLLSNTNEKYQRLNGFGTPNTETDRKKLESLIKANEQAEAISFLKDQVSNPEFIRNFDDYKNKSLVDFASEVTRKNPDTKDEKLSPVVELLTDFLNRQKQFGLFQKLADEAQQVFMETMDQRQMINHIAKAIITVPECLESSYFYENQEAVNAAKEIHKKICGKGVGEAYQA